MPITLTPPTPVASFVGGLGLALPVHALLVLNGSVFGISGFIHRAVRGSTEAIASVAGLMLGGVLIGALEGPARGSPLMLDDGSRLWWMALSGGLVGVGTRLGNGCTSGHMLCGLSRFSPRSLVATLTFFLTGALTARFLHTSSFSPTPLGSWDWTLGPVGLKLLALQLVPIAVEAGLYFLGLPSPPTPDHRRTLASLTTSTHFSLPLHLSSLTSPTKVLPFLLLPLHPSFDPSLAFLALGAIPLAAWLYHRIYLGGCRKTEGKTEDKKPLPPPRLGGHPNVPLSRKIDGRLLLGAAIFGVGWGMQGVCPGPALVNFGRALTALPTTTPELLSLTVWLGSMILGGLLF